MNVPKVPPTKIKGNDERPCGISREVVVNPDGEVVSASVTIVPAPIVSSMSAHLDYGPK